MYLLVQGRANFLERGPDEAFGLSHGPDVKDNRAALSGHVIRVFHVTFWFHPCTVCWAYFSIGTASILERNPLPLGHSPSEFWITASHSEIYSN